ncbi:MAG: helix-turn-helix transcriptional regulator [Crocinitomicaceae bacterium]
MATNKNALLRYKTLDRCLRNSGREYTFEDLLTEINDALAAYDAKSDGIRERQLREDLRFMRSENGYNAPIETRIIDKKLHAYFYTDPNFSIHNSPLNETEAKILKNSLDLFQRFKGSPGFEWVEQFDVVLKEKLGSGKETVVSFESNIDYVGSKWFSPLFNAIVQKRALWITYTPFNAPSFSFVFHPYHLKQYNNRWFVFGLNHDLSIATWNLSLDRIDDIHDSKYTYVPMAADWDWDYYFSDIIGVTRYDKEPERIKLLFSAKRGKYVETKPIHETQRNKWTDDGFLVTLDVIPNLELEQVILSYGEDVKVLSPLSLQKKMQTRVQALADMYKELP